MIAVETTGRVSADGELVVKLPIKLPPGEHRVVVAVDAPTDKAAAPEGAALPTVSVGRWPENLSFRREDIYENDDR